MFGHLPKLEPIKKFSICDAFQPCQTEREAEIAFRAYAYGVGFDLALENLRFGFGPGGYFEAGGKSSEVWGKVLERYKMIKALGE